MRRTVTMLAALLFGAATPAAAPLPGSIALPIRPREIGPDPLPPLIPRRMRLDKLARRFRRFNPEPNRPRPWSRDESFGKRMAADFKRHRKAYQKDADARHQANCCANRRHGYGYTRAEVRAISAEGALLF